ncbi:MAG: tyrosine-type recombinase/integrase [Dysgonomonas sp.]
MYSIRFKGRRDPINVELVKLEMIFFKTDYARVSKVLKITGFYDEWNEKKQRFNEKSYENILKNKLLQKLRLKYLIVIDKWESREINWIPVELSHYYDKPENKKKKNSSVSEMLDYLIESFVSRERFKNGKVISSKRNAELYKMLKRSLEDFTMKKYAKKFSKYRFKDITQCFILDYCVYIQKMGMKNNNAGGIRNKLKVLHATMKYALNEKIPNVNMSVFIPVREKMNSNIFMTKSVSAVSLHKIEGLDRNVLKEKDILSLDLFLFSYYTGLSNIDICFLSCNKIKDNMIVQERIKCNREVRIILTEKAKVIIERYKSKSVLNHVFPAIKVEDVTEDMLYERVKKVSLAVNHFLSVICKQEGILEKITWSSGRSSFISKMIDEGFHPLLVAELAGNTPNAIQKYYYSNTDKEKVREKMNEVF